jgi:hypothetical protein
MRLLRNRLSTAARVQPYSATFALTPRLTAKRRNDCRSRREGTVGAAPLSKSEMAVGLLSCGSASASCLNSGTACGLVGAALAVFVSGGCRGSVFGSLAAAVWVALAGAAFAFGAASRASWPRPSIRTDC